VPLLGLLRVFGFFVLVPAEVEDAADGGRAVGENLDQIEAVVFGDTNGIARRHDTQLAAVSADDADLRETNAVVDTKRWLVPMNVFAFQVMETYLPGFGCSGLLVQASPWLRSSLVRFPGDRHLVLRTAGLPDSGRDIRDRL